MERIWSCCACATFAHGLGRYTSIHAALKVWGHWRRGALSVRVRGSSQTYGVTPPERMQVSRPCQTCRAAKSIWDVVTEDYVSCPECKGRGSVKQWTLAVDGAGIKRTGPGGMQVRPEVPEVIIVIDDAVNGFDLCRRAVLLTRYVDNLGTGTERLDAANQKLRQNGEAKITKEKFSMLLADARLRLAAVTGIAE